MVRRRAPEPGRLAPCSSARQRDPGVDPALWPVPLLGELGAWAGVEGEGRRAVSRPADGFMEAVYAVVKLIPRGRVASYGQVATFVVSPRHARAVGAALRHLPPDRQVEVPWQRVINAGGRISHRGDVERPIVQRRLLEEEGIGFGGTGVVDWRRFGWEGPPDDWEPPFPYPFPTRPPSAARVRGGWIVDPPG